MDLRPCFSAVDHRKKKGECGVNPSTVAFTFRFPHVLSSFSFDLFLRCQFGFVSVGSVCAYTANMATRLFGLAFCFSVSLLCAPRLPLIPNVVEQDNLGHQSDCLEALGFGVGGWGAVVGLRFVALPLATSHYPVYPRWC